MSYFRKLKDWLPKPFQYLQRQLDIQSQWKDFKTNINPHRYKIYLLLLFAFYPIYNPFLQEYLFQFKKYMTKKTHQMVQPEQPTFQIGQNLIKNLIDSLLKDQNVKNQGLSFVNKIILDDKFVTEILQLLLSALKNQEFFKALGDISKDLILTQLRDKQISDQLNIFIQKIASSQQTKTAFIKLIQVAFSSKESIDTIVNLLQKGISSTEVKQALSDTVNYSVKQLLADEQTINQIKVFVFFLLRKFESDDQIKGMMDVLFAKGLGLVKKPKKHPELDKILKVGRQKPTDYL